MLNMVLIINKQQYHEISSKFNEQTLTNFSSSAALFFSSNKDFLSALAFALSSIAICAVAFAVKKTHEKEMRWSNIVQCQSLTIKQCLDNPILTFVMMQSYLVLELSILLSKAANLPKCNVFVGGLFDDTFDLLSADEVERIVCSGCSTYCFLMLLLFLSMFFACVITVLLSASLCSRCLASSFLTGFDWVV